MPPPAPTTAPSAAPACTPVAGRATCPSCQTILAVRSELAGRRIKCRCGHLFQAPDAAAMADALAKMAADAAIALGHMPARKCIPIEDQTAAPRQPNILLDFYLPLLLISLGVVLCFVQAMYVGTRPHRFLEIVGPTILGMVACLGLMIAGVLAAALSMGMVFETRPRETALKIAAVALIPSAAGAIIDQAVGGINGNILGVLAAVALYTALVKAILRQPWDNTAIIVFVCWTVRTFVMYAVYKCQGAASGSWL